MSNYLPVTLLGQITIPFELAHRVKPDIRTLIPMFSIAYTDKVSDSTNVRENLDAQSLRGIVIGQSDKSNCVEFYHPPLKNISRSVVYKSDTTVAAGPIINIRYDGGLFFNTYHNEADKHLQDIHTLDSIVCIIIKE